MSSRARILFSALLFCAVGATGAPTGNDFRSDYLELRRLIGHEQFSEAFDRCKELLAENPSNLSLYETLAEVAQYAGTLNKAASYFLQNIDDGNQPGLSHFGLGLVAYYSSDFPTAVAEYSRAIEYGVQEPECYRMLEYAHEKGFGVEATIGFLTSHTHRVANSGYAYYGLALAYWGKQQYEKANSCLDLAIEKKPYDNRLRAAKGAIVLLSGSMQNGKQLCAKVETMLSDEPDREVVLFLRSYQALADIWGAHWMEATVRIGELIAEAKEYGYYRWLGWGYKHLSDVEFLSERYERSLEFAEKALQACNRCRNNELSLAVLTRKFEAHMELGEFESALQCQYGKVHGIGLKGLDPDSIRTLCDFAWVYHELRQDNVALDYAISALIKAEAFGADRASFFRIHSILGMIQEGLGNYSSALESYERSLSLLPPGAIAKKNLAIICGNIGRAYLLLGNLKKAGNHFAMQLKYAEREGFRREQAYAHSNLGEYFLRRHMLLPARRHYENALRFSQELAHRPTILLSMRGVAKVAEEQQEFRQALSLYRQCAEVANSMGIQDLNSVGRSTDSEMDFEDERNCLRILISLGKVREAFVLSENMKAEKGIDFVVSLYSAHASSVRDSLKSALVGLRNQIEQEIDIQSKRFVDGVGVQLDQKSFLNRQNEIHFNELKYRLVLDSIRLHDPKYSAFLVPIIESPMSLLDSLLGKEAALLSYVETQNRLIAFCVTCDTICAFLVDAPARQLSELVTLLSPMLSSECTNKSLQNATLANFNAKAASSLYSELVKPVERLIHGKRSLVISADGILRRLPFEVLISSQDATTNDVGFSRSSMMLQAYEISYRGNSMFVSGGKTFLPPSKPLLAIGNPTLKLPPSRSQQSGHKGEVMPAERISLPGSEREVYSIIRAYGGLGHAVVGAKATKAELLQTGKDYAIIHIATHAVFDERRPIHSSLFLSGDSEDGQLFAYELLDANIGSDLVVLSACNTTQWTGTKGMDGFVGALFFGGTKSVIASLWTVDDETTAFLMERMYNYLWQGHSKAQALQRAKLELIGTGKSDPFYWASFVLLGDPFAVQKPEQGAQAQCRWIYFTVPFVSLLIALVAVRRLHWKWH